MRRDVAGAAGVGVVAPGAADLAGPLEDDEARCGAPPGSSRMAAPRPAKPLPTIAHRDHRHRVCRAGHGHPAQAAGIHDFVILEQAGGVGGTWRDNHYPGGACDVPSHLYSFSFAANPGWTRTFAPQPEIFAYLERCTDKYGLRPHLRFRTRGARGPPSTSAPGCWDVEATDGGRQARALVSGCGGLSRPSLPDIPGLASFEGKTFHSARWDHGVALAGTPRGGDRHRRERHPDRARDPPRVASSPSSSARRPGSCRARPRHSARRAAPFRRVARPPAARARRGSTGARAPRARRSSSPS